MRALVVFESLFGNTHAVAEQIAAGLCSATDTELLPVGAVTPGHLQRLDLLVVGGPTHIHGLSWSTSRKTAAEDAAKTDGAAGRPAEDAVERGLRDWLHDLPTTAGTAAAAFDTRFQKHVAVTGSAARGIARRLRHHGYRLLEEPMSFHVVDMPGPLAPGELDRARGWGGALAAHLQQRTAA